MTMTGPDRGLLDTSAQRQFGVSRRGDVCRTRRSRPTSPRSSRAEGYITDYRTEDARVGKSLVVQLKYGPSRERSIAGLRRVSKPGLRVYAKSTNLPRVLGGLGVAIISTSSGLLTDRQAARQGVGGEVLAYVW